MNTPRPTDPTQMQLGTNCTARFPSRLLALAAVLMLGACTTNDGTIRTYQPPAGANEMLYGSIDSAPGHALTMGDLVFAPDTPIARHTHAGEEFLYVMGGSIIISRQGEPDVTVEAGEGLRIPPNKIHWGRAGSDGARGVASWVRIDGQPLRTPVPN